MWCSTVRILYDVWIRLDSLRVGHFIQVSVHVDLRGLGDSLAQTTDAIRN